MARPIGGFKSTEARERFLAIYDELCDRSWPVARQELDIPTRFGSTHVRRSGPDHGGPVVLLHPLTGTSLSWYRLVAPLADHYPIYAIDTIGTPGRSVQVAAVTGPRDFGDWLDETLAGLGLDGVHVVGYSEGGWIALLAAVHSPGRLASLTLIEPGGALHRVRASLLARMVLTGAVVVTGLRPAETTMAKFARWLAPGVELTDLELRLAATALKTYRQRLPWPRPLSDDELRSVDLPILVLLGENTVLFDALKAGARAEAIMPIVAVDITPGTGHGLPMERPELVTSRIIDFIAESRQALATQSDQNDPGAGTGRAVP